MFKRKKLLILSIPNTYLQDQLGDIAYYYENKKKGNLKTPIPLKVLLNAIYTKKFPQLGMDGSSYYSYPYLKTSLTMEHNTALAANTKKQKNILFSLNKYYFLNDIVMLDIIANNINTHPVYFTSTANVPFENNTMQKGIVYKLIADNINLPYQKSQEIAGLQKFISEKYIPVLSNDSTLISFDGDAVFFTLYNNILGYYLDKKDTLNEF